MKKLSRTVEDRLVEILFVIIALAFWTAFFYFQILINSDDHKSEPLKQIQYENVELTLLKVGMPINGDIIKLKDFINKGYVVKKTTVGGILGIVLIASNNDTINPTADEITYFSDIHELDTLPIQNMIKDIEHTFNIEFIKAPMDSEIDLFTIKNNVEFDCSFSNFHLMFSMKRRYD